MAYASYRLRRLHRFLGVTVGIQLLFWTVSGLFFAWSDLDAVHGDPQKNTPSPLPMPDSMGSPGKALANLRRTEGAFDLSELRLISILGKPCWQITFIPAAHREHGMKMSRLADAQTGDLRPALSEGEAVEMAKAAFNGQPEVQKVEYLTETNGHHEFRDDPLPAYAVTFQHPTQTTVYVSTERGTVQKFRNDAWRWFDLLWMFHTMDYRTRDDINNWVLRAFSLLGLLTVMSGFALFFATARRRKVAAAILLLLTGFSGKMTAQTFSAEQALQAALQYHPSVKAAAFEAKAKKQAERAALNLPNPEINAESPTGEFYAVGVSQSFDFPTVYIRQRQVAKAETALAQAGQRLSENELCYAVRKAYLDAQVAEQAWIVAQKRDSLHQQIAAAAARQFAAGDIDFLQKSNAELAAGKTRAERDEAQIRLEQAKLSLLLLTGWQQLPGLEKLQPDTLWGPTVDIIAETAPTAQYEAQNLQLAEREARLSRSRALPNFSVGYLNQGPRNTAIDYRFKASIGIPLWAGQYRAGQKAADSAVQAAQSRLEAEQQTIRAAFFAASSDWQIAKEKVRYYRQEALPRSRAALAAAIRFREGGQIDYPAFLLQVAGYFAIENEYLEQVKNLQTAQIFIKYLRGELE